MKYLKIPMAWLLELAALLLEVAVAIVTLPASQRFWFKSKMGIDFESSPGEVTERVAIKLLERFGKPMNILNTSIQIATSIGIAIHDSNRDCDAREMIRQADMAMYEAKGAGRNRYFIQQ